MHRLFIFILLENFSSLFTYSSAYFFMLNLKYLGGLCLLICNLMPVWLEDTPFIIFFDFHFGKVILQHHILSVKLWVYVKDMYTLYKIFYKWKRSEIGWKHHSGPCTEFSVCLMCIFLAISRGNCVLSYISLIFLFISDSLRIFYDNLTSNKIYI